MSVCAVLEAVFAKADGCIKDTEGTLHTAGQENELFDLIIEEASYIDWVSPHNQFPGDTLEKSATQSCYSIFLAQWCCLGNRLGVGDVTKGMVQVNLQPGLNISISNKESWLDDLFLFAIA